MNHMRWDILLDFIRALGTSLFVGLIWSFTAILFVLVLARYAGAPA
jgi:hypothetical protein